MQAAWWSSHFIIIDAIGLKHDFDCLTQRKVKSNWWKIEKIDPHKGRQKVLLVSSCCFLSAKLVFYNISKSFFTLISSTFPTKTRKQFCSFTAIIVVCVLKIPSNVQDIYIRFQEYSWYLRLCYVTLNCNTRLVTFK